MLTRSDVLQKLKTKKFYQLSSEERHSLTDDDFYNLPIEDTLACPTCKYLGAYVNWWCFNDEAFEVRRTRIPNICLCDFYKPSPYRLKCRSATYRAKQKGKLIWPLRLIRVIYKKTVKSLKIACTHVLFFCKKTEK